MFHVYFDHFLQFFSLYNVLLFRMLTTWISNDMLPPIICVTPKNRKTGEKLPVRSTRAPKRIGKLCNIVILKLLIDYTIVQVRLT